jgi:hypothetical protein
MATLLARSRALCQSLSLARTAQPQTFRSGVRWFFSSSSQLDDGDASDISKSQGNAAIVDPESDSTLKEVLAIPVPKPLIPGAGPIPSNA